MSRQEKTERTDRVLKKKRGNSAALCSAAGTIILVLVILACLPLTLPRLAGYSLYAVVSGSMEPEIPVGSLVLVHGTEPENVVEGDVIAFFAALDSETVITHRVVSNSPAMGEFITKGDANEERDMNPVSYKEFIGRVEAVIPAAGSAAQLLAGPSGRIAAAALLTASVALLLTGRMLEKAAQRGGDEAEKAPEETAEKAVEETTEKETGKKTG